jgi:hypothetical protein
MKARLICPAALLLALSGCATSNTSRYLMAKPLPPYSGPIAVLLPGQPPPASFNEIAILQALRFEGEDVRYVTARLVKEAAAIGCDTIINFRAVKSDKRWDLYGQAMWTAASGTCGTVRQAPGSTITPSRTP